MTVIKSLKARKILDSRGSWTIEAELEAPQGLFIDSCPSGASTGKYEAKTVSADKAVENIKNIVAPKLKGMNIAEQAKIDGILKELNIGANATTAVSMAVCRAGAIAQGKPLYCHVAELCGHPMSAKLADIGCPQALPKPVFNMINGGAHATNKLDFQEFMVVCDFRKASEIYQDLRKKLGKNVGDEGGFAPSFSSPKGALEFLSKYNVKIIIDVAASQFSAALKKKYNAAFYDNLIRKYPIIAMEDPFPEDDFDSWQKFKPKNITIIGDDLLATNPKRIKMAREKNLCNGLLLKINQIGTVSEALEAAKLAKSYYWKIMVSHRSGETNDDFIADFAVGIGADYIKAGAPARGERVAKYNRLLRIEEDF